MKTVKKLYIVGAGSVGGHVASNINTYKGNFDMVGFFDDDPEKIGKEFCGFPVLGPVKEVLSLKSVSIVIGIAFPGIKEKLIRILKKNQSLLFPSLIHERAWISDHVQIGNGAIIYPGCSINYGSCIGNFVVMNMNCAVGHHSSIGDYSSLAPGVNLGGHTKIMESVDMGIGVSTIQNVVIHRGAVIGGQAMVVSDIPRDCVAKGVPAKN